MVWKADHDRCSLGDWEVNRLKLPDGLDGLGKKIEDLGMQFGLWVEPKWYLRTVICIAPTQIGVSM